MFLPKNDKDKVKFLMRLYEGVKEQMSTWRDRAETYCDLYDSYVNSEEYPLKFDVFIPLAYSTIETMIPRYVNGLLYRHPLVQVTSAHPMTPWDSVENAHRLLNNKWLIDAETWYDQLMMVVDHLKVGTAPGKIVFTRRKQAIKTRKPLTFNGLTSGHVEEKRYVNVMNRPRLLSRSIFDVYPDLDNPRPSDMRFVFEDMIKGMDEIESSGYYDHSAVEELRKMADWDVSDTELRRRFKTTDTPMNDQNVMWEFKPRKLTEIVYREFTPLGEIIHLVCIGNEKVLLRDDIIGYWPWVFLHNNRQQGEFLGHSEIEQLEGLQYAVNDLTNMSLENMLMSLTKMWIVGDEAEADLNQFVLEPFGVIQVSDIQQVKAESWADVNPSGMKLMQFLMQMGNQASGIHDMLRGVTAPRQEFATTVMALQQAAEARVDSKIKNGDKTWLSPTARAFISCAQEELDEAEYVPDPSNPGSFFEVDMYGLQGLLDYNTSAAGAGIKEIQRAGYNDFIGVVPQLVPELPAPMRIDLAIAVAKTYEGMGEVIEQLLQLKKATAGAASPDGQALAGGINPTAGFSGESGLDNLATSLAKAQEAYIQPNTVFTQRVESSGPVV